MPAPDLMQMLARLVALPSVSSVSPEFDLGNRAVIDELAGWCEAAGFAVEVTALSDRPAKANLVATLGRGPGGLVLAGHTDTVPCDEALWRADPFRLDERDGRLHGLGTSDMKSFFALILEAVRSFDPRDFRFPLVILATADEESSMCGARAIMEAGRPLGRHAVIGEPTGLRPVRMHKGVLMEGVRLTGRSGHSSDPALGVNALEGMHRAIGEILRFREEMQARYRNDAFAVPVPTLNLGHIHGGDNPNRICGSCELHFDLRPLPGMEPEALCAEIERRLARELEGSGIGLEMLRLSEGVPPMETPAEAEIVRAAESLTGHTAEAVSFGTEAPYLRALGMDVVVLGPGDIAQAHQPDEYLALDRIGPSLELLRALIRRFCLA